MGFLAKISFPDLLYHFKICAAQLRSVTETGHEITILQWNLDIIKGQGPVSRKSRLLTGQVSYLRLH